MFSSKDLDTKIRGHKGAILPIAIHVATRELRLSRSPVDYQDVVAEAMLGVAKATKDYRRGFKTKFSSYVHLRVTGAVRDILRREAANAGKHEYGLEADEFLDQDVSLNDRISQAEVFRVVLDILVREVPAELANLLVLYYLEDMTDKQISSYSSNSAGTVNRLRHKALDLVRQALLKRGITSNGSFSSRRMGTR